MPDKNKNNLEDIDFLTPYQEAAEKFLKAAAAAMEASKAAADGIDLIYKAKGSLKSCEEEWKGELSSREAYGILTMKILLERDLKKSLKSLEDISRSGISLQTTGNLMKNLLEFGGAGNSEN